ncbi:MAG: helix-turn-helix transcriptional regulator [Bacillota bacterium]
MQEFNLASNQDVEQENINTQKEYSTLVKRCILTMETEYLYLLGIAEIADFLGVSKHHLIRLFSKEVGISPQKYFIKYKLLQSKILLADHGLAIESVALGSGFSTGNYYTKVFKKEYGLTPSEYRKDLPVTIPKLATEQMYL